MVKKPLVTALLRDRNVVTESSDEARELYNKSRFGKNLDSGKVQLSFIEALYLLEAGKLELKNASGRTLTLAGFIRKAKRMQPNFWLRYTVFKDLRNRGYIVKTALKFGADFRIYERGVKPGEKHAKWIVFPVKESAKMTWQDFAAKNRVAHSTKKNLLLAVVDDEGAVSYWEVRWLRP